MQNSFDVWDNVPEDMRNYLQFNGFNFNLPMK